MAKYKIGNILRGYIEFRARSDRVAWEKGRVIFNEALPTDHKTGRQIELYVEKHVPVLYTETYVRYADKSDRNVWVPVVIGFSGELYPGRRGVKGVAR